MPINQQTQADNTTVTVDENIMKEILAIIDSSDEITAIIKELVVFIGEIDTIKTFLQNILVPIHINTRESNNTLALWQNVEHSRVYYHYNDQIDVHNPIQEISNTFYCYKLFNTITRINLVMLTPYTSLENATQSFFSLISKFLNLFKSIAELKDNFVLMITATGRRITTTEIKEEIQNIVQDYEYELNARQIEFLKFLSSEKSKLVLIKLEDQNPKDVTLDSMYIEYNGRININLSITEPVKLYYVMMFNHITTKIMKNIDAILESMRLHHECLLEQMKFVSADLLVKQAKNYLYNLSEAKELDLATLINIPEQIVKIVKHQIINIRNKFGDLMFFKRVIPEQYQSSILPSAIQSSLKLTINCLTKNMNGIIIQKVVTTIDIVYQTMIQHIKQRTLPIPNKEYFNYLDAIRCATNLSNYPLRTILTELEQLLAAIDLASNSNDLRILELLDNENKDFCITYLRNNIETLYLAYKKHMCL